MNDLPDIGDLASGWPADLDDPRAKRRGPARRTADALTAFAGALFAVVAFAGFVGSDPFSPPWTSLPARAFDALAWPLLTLIALAVAYLILAVLADGADALWRWLRGRETSARAEARRNRLQSKLAAQRARRAAAANDIKPSERGTPDEHT
ncbi:hypothetical protein GCM10008171_00060 [Methylopila jiangsuensis]|uniref:Uncharacterized protein n=1 Tax=Methylopila jiangsuensis TaxID=586230 RepID=A0A9W6N1C7_9HYPH|nr:hypothetical protein [Methylopila jiangsuensis]MDR6287498.1 4-amino-4-deoxy-L-arabinose transferase-like glycosyltransferase [Methylopila jiangsuensis]GLK74754.1 hypothetical protein GCM10008171_00060 [Methylopila jiangsuensis]